MTDPFDILAAEYRPMVLAYLRAMVFDGMDRNPAEIDWWESRKSALRDCVALLSGHLAAAVDSAYFSGNSLDQSAGILKSTPAAVGQRLSRARTRIRECMGRKLQQGCNEDDGESGKCSPYHVDLFHE